MSSHGLMERLSRYIEKNRELFIEDLRRICREPSVSAQGRGIEGCVREVSRLMREVGIEAETIPVEGGNPVILGTVKADPDAGCIGFYNHYDVQPPEPLELWETPPFEADVRNGKIYARGVSDNKGVLVARIEAVRTILNVMGRIPVNLKFMVEGEEEVGSPNLPSFVRKNMNRLKADGYLWEGNGVDEKGRPVITLGAKGILYVEFRARGANRDLHSSMAPIIPNPAWRIVWALSSMKGPDGRIRIEGWYDDVIEPAEVELKLLREAPFEEDAKKKELGLKSFLNNLTGIDALKALYLTPTCNICGLNSGYTGPGSKTVLPSEAMAKVDFRLVEAQRPDRLIVKLRRHLEREGFGDVEIVSYGGYEPAKTPPDNPFVKFVIETAERIYKSKPVVWPTSAGTSPIYTIKNWMGIPVASAGGVGYPGSNIHAPNENIRISDYLRAIIYTVALITSYKPSK